MIMKIIGFLMLFIGFISIYYGSWLNDSFLYRIPFNISVGSSSPIYGFQLELHINTSKYISEGKMKPDCSDIRVSYYNSSLGDEQLIPFWIADGECNTENTTIWIKAPVLNLTPQRFFVYFGNSNAESLSNGNTVFDFFDDFNDDYFSRSV